jgi:thiol-disulfide isomerase/thioredoxin
LNSLSGGDVHPMNHERMNVLCAIPVCFLSAQLFMALAEEVALVDLTGPYSAVVSVRNPDGSPAAGVRYKLSYFTPSQREVILDSGTAQQRKFQFESFRLIAPIAAGNVPEDGKIRLHHLAGAPRTFSLQVGDDGTRPGDFPEGAGYLQITFTNRALRTNTFTLDLPKTVALGGRAPDFSVKDVFTGQRRTLSDFSNKLVVLKFWATTCPPCQPEMEEINQLIERKKKEWADRVAFVGVSLDDDGERLGKHIRKQGWTGFQHVWPQETNGGFSSAIAQSYGIRAVPAGYVIHPTGTVIWRGDFGQVENLVDHFLTKVNRAEDIQSWLKEIQTARDAR